jgi:carbonic anhydrase
VVFVKDTKQLFENNKVWVEAKKSLNEKYFDELSEQQNPEYLWIGCSDSRIAANEIVGMDSGSIFVHRNIANVVVHTDFNCLSVIQYAVEVLKIKHIIVVGHYGCGGIRASLEKQDHGFIEGWLEHIREVYRDNKTIIDAGESDEERENILCESNVRRQVNNVCRTPMVKKAWANGQNLSVHGWVYSLKDGLIKDLDVTFVKAVID